MNSKVVLQSYIIPKKAGKSRDLDFLFLITEVSHQENEDLPVKISSTGIWITNRQTEAVE